MIRDGLVNARKRPCPRPIGWTFLQLLGLRAIGAQQKREARAHAKRAETLNEAVSNDMDAVLADMKGKDLLKPAQNLVTACRESIQSDFRLSFIVGMLQQDPNMVNIIASQHRVDLAACEAVGPGHMLT